MSEPESSEQAQESTDSAALSNGSKNAAIGENALPGDSARATPVAGAVEFVSESPPRTDGRTAHAHSPANWHRAVDTASARSPRALLTLLALASAVAAASVAGLTMTGGPTLFRVDAAVEHLELSLAADTDARLGGVPFRADSDSVAVSVKNEAFVFSGDIRVFAGARMSITRVPTGDVWIEILSGRTAAPAAELTFESGLKMVEPSRLFLKVQRARSSAA
jgi:hypothetical protein